MAKIKNVAIQMDHVSGINIAGDSTFAISLEAQARGYRLFHYTPDRLSMRDGKIYATVEQMQLRDINGEHFSLAEPERVDLATMDVIHLRQDPPFDMAYITATHILEMIHPKTLVVNDPASVRNAPEKLFVMEFPELMPDTMITHDPAEVRRFREKHGDIIVKPLFGNGGAGVFHLRPDDSNVNSLLELFAERSREPLMIQQYVPAVRLGDKRIILIDGEPLGAINRVPAAGESRSNMHVGGRPEQVALTPRDREICARIGPELRKRGMIFVGIDVIGDYLTEINVTSPTGLQEVARFDGVHLEKAIWDAIERKRAG